VKVSLKSGIHLAIAVALAMSACGSSEEDYGPDEPEDTTPDPIPNLAPVPPPTSIVCPNSTYLTYENFGKGFMANYCTSCHSESVPETARGGTPLEANFDTANDVLIWRKAIMDRTLRGVASGPSTSTSTDTATSTGTDTGTGTTPIPANLKMPPSGHVTESDLAAFTEWMNCGAPVGN
jgi:hypothetical protein